MLLTLTLTLTRLSLALHSDDDDALPSISRDAISPISHGTEARLLAADGLISSLDTARRGRWLGGHAQRLPPPDEQEMLVALPPGSRTWQRLHIASAAPRPCRPCRASAGPLCGLAAPVPDHSAAVPGGSAPSGPLRTPSSPHTFNLRLLSLFSNQAMLRDMGVSRWASLLAEVRGYPLPPHTPSLSRRAAPTGPASGPSSVVTPSLAGPPPPRARKPRTGSHSHPRQTCKAKRALLFAGP